MKREYYSDPIELFLTTSPDSIIGKLAMNNDFALEQSQRDAWLKEIQILQLVLNSYHGTIWFEYSMVTSQ